MSSLIFQAIDWQIKTVRNKDSQEISETIIQVFGKTHDCKDVYLEINDFEFSFFVKSLQLRSFKDDERLLKSIQFYLGMKYKGLPFNRFMCVY